MLFTLAQGAFDPVARGRHPRVFVFQRRIIGQHFEIKRDLAAFFKRQRAETAHLLRHQIVHEIEIGGGPPGPGGGFAVADGRVGPPVQGGVMRPHLFEKFIVAQRDHRRDPEAGHFQRGVDREPRSQNRDMKGMRSVRHRRAGPVQRKVARGGQQTPAQPPGNRLPLLQV